ncbi:MAG: hypothetical protein QOC78_816 [Solirubrobacteraceae bacterium]|jgi:hypothetical protein|nr:hypothetical protein [Solirubrobacteraceae bacterium]
MLESYPLRRSAPRRPAHGAGATLLVVAATAAGVGWLYLLRDLGALAAGPRVPASLPLQRLAGGDAQPLVRVAVAWLSAGLAAGVALTMITELSRAARALAIAAIAWVVLFASGAASDAITASEPLGGHVWPQLDRSATWLACGLMALAALIPSSRTRPDGAGVATRRGVGVSGAP